MPGRSPQAVPALTLPALVLLATGLFGTRLGCPLLEPEETRYAEIPRQMLREGRFVEPVWHGAPYYHKPPLLYWLVMGSYRLFGVHDWAARLVPALAALATVLVTFAWGARAAGARTGFLAALVLCLSPRFVYLGRMLTLDGLLCLWVTAALAAAQFALGGPRLRWRWWLVSAVSCGLGVLTKGPVALVLVLVPVLLWRPLVKRFCRAEAPGTSGSWGTSEVCGPPLRAWLAYLLVAGAVAGPWYLAAAVRDPQAAAGFFWQHNVQRYLAPLDHPRPFWFYVPGLLLGTLPWSLLLLPLARLLWRRDPAEAALRPPALIFGLIASLWCLLFFSASGCKRAGYVLPCLPPLALALGCHLARSVRWGSAPQPADGRAARPRAGWAQAALLVALLLGAGGSLTAGHTGIWPVAQGHVTAGALGLGCVAALLWGGRLSERAAWGLCAGTMLALALVAVDRVLPGYHRKFALRGQVRRHRDLAGDARLPVVCYPHRWDSVSFYLQRQDVTAYDPAHRGELLAALRASPRTLVFVKSERSRDGCPLEDLLGALPPSLELVPRGRKGSVVTVGVVRRVGAR
jgi:4-amino-4-deoxy-L-arabinose transferase-like glycosyltransferase